MYSRFPEDEFSGSKHVEDIKKLKYLENVHFFGLYFILILQFTV